MKASDHFSQQPADYSLYRPTYPGELFRHLADLCPVTDLCWDCATGNGQAAIGLALHFEKVIATDVSAAQIKQATPIENIEYRVADADQSDLDPTSIDLIVVAQALHWFDIEDFYREAKRVLKPEGILAIICYRLPRIDPAIDSIIDTFHGEILAEYWPPERRHVDTAYRNIAFPLVEIPPPSLRMEHHWTLDQFLGYLRSWSAVVYFEKEQKRNPLDLIKSKLSVLWSAPEIQKTVSWPLTIRTGKF